MLDDDYKYDPNVKYAVGDYAWWVTFKILLEGASVLGIWKMLLNYMKIIG